ncbi:MAG TPA: UTP--glucose-1-phosphate uridylyltransferase [Verrucomicrobiales bacterium]|nr:UTP--glucose-1-phosphate uridylyltransferase [Verrucomicrobiales bacterium]
MTPEALDTAIRDKMLREGIAPPSIAAFLGSVHKVMAGATGLLAEGAISPVESLPRMADLGETVSPPDLERLLAQLAVIKLNGGLGTGMGLEKAKSLLTVREGSSFLDYTARQILQLRSRSGQGSHPRFYLMNSFNTREDTLAHLRQYPELWDGVGRIDFLQNKVPKIDPATFEPVSWPAHPELEWCPPGHGDLYPSLLGCGLLDELLAAGVRYLFVSNSDNLGATVDARLLGHFASSGLSFLMEVAERTDSDRKGGHLTRRRSDGRLVLRESAQCPREDEAEFQNVARHRFFNTNNLWVRLDHLKAELDRCGGALPLDLIRNAKTVDPRNPESPRVLQLESAMGAAIGCFDGSGAIVVPRERFSPVKTTSDLLALRSDAYRLTEDHRLVLAESRGGRPPLVDLDQAYYRMVGDLEQAFPEGAPSLIDCEALKVTGPFRFEAEVVLGGRVEFANRSPKPQVIRSGSYTESVIRF